MQILYKNGHFVYFLQIDKFQKWMLSFFQIRKIYAQAHKSI
jgi:hypothetical protein